MWNLGQIHHEHIVGDGLSECYRKLEARLLELFRVQYAVHRYNVRLLVGHLYTYSSLSRHRGNDADAQCSEAQSYVVFKVFDARNLHSRCRSDLVKGDGGPHGGSY